MDTMARSDDLDERLDAAVLELVAADKLNAKIFEHGPGDPGPSWEKREEAIAKVARAWNMRQRHEQRERKIMLYELGRHEFADAVRLIEDQQWTILKLRRAKERAVERIPSTHYAACVKAFQHAEQKGMLNPVGSAYLRERGWSTEPSPQATAE
jgi:hypothetical protein